MSKLAGHALTVLSFNVQKNLMRMGFDWDASTGAPQHLKIAARLRINCSCVPSPKTILFDSEPLLITSGETIVFDASTDCDAFFRAAKNVMAFENNPGLSENLQDLRDLQDLEAIFAAVLTEAILNHPPIKL
jgi:hypothetical protein